MTYREALRYLGSFYDYERDIFRDKTFLNLDRMNRLVRASGDPHMGSPSIHIAGTKGKGSVACFLSNVLREAGYKVGLYTSPHLARITERLSVNNKEIGKKEFALLTNRARSVVEGLPNPIKPSFFELFTLMCFMHFASKKVDLAVFETGMGGRFDATNVLRPLVSVITSISLDHMEELGSKITDIAREKREIIKKGSICVSAPQEPEVLSLIREKCKSENVKLFAVGTDIIFRGLSCNDKREVLDVETKTGKFRKLRTQVLGRHQLENAAVVIGTVEALKEKGYQISHRAVYAGIKKTRLRGRCEVINKNPLVVLDSAHNKESADALKKTISRNFNVKKIILVLAIMKDKDIKGITGTLAEIADRVIITKADTPRSADPGMIRRFVKNRNVIVADNVSKAYNISKELAGKDDMIVITGSFYLAGEFLKGPGSRCSDDKGPGPGCSDDR